MGLKELWNKIFGTGSAIDEFYSKDDKAIIANYKELLKQKNEQLELQKATSDEKISSLDLEVTKAQNNILAMTKEIEFLRNQLSGGSGIPAQFEELRQHYDTKYPTKNITYPGRPIPYKDGNTMKSYTPSVPVQSFIFDFAELREYVKSKGLTWDAALNEHKNFGVAMDKLRELIYDEVIRMRRYRYDKDLFGNVENWSGPWISFFLKVSGRRYMDCEDSSLLFMAMMKAAGVPRGFQRCVVGDTSLGGHAAVHVYSFEKEDWLHYETTATSSAIYARKDTNNQLDITNVWWSFDWEYAWSEEPASVSLNYERAKK